MSEETAEVVGHVDRPVLYARAILERISSHLTTQKTLKAATRTRSRKKQDSVTVSQVSGGERPWDDVFREFPPGRE